MTHIRTNFIQYEHHNELVWVRSDLKGTHRDVCLCYQCTQFRPGSTGNCPIAQQLYHLDVQYNLVTPVFECPHFKEHPNVDNDDETFMGIIAVADVPDVSGTVYSAELLESVAQQYPALYKFRDGKLYVSNCMFSYKGDDRAGR
jgi:hypothetical protein